jgi:hypothetical protein
MENINTSQEPSEVDAQPSSGWTPTNGITPQTESGAATSPQGADPSEHPAKRRREEKERTRVSRACDRCKK